MFRHRLLACDRIMIMKGVLLALAIGVTALVPSVTMAADCTGVGSRAGDVFQNYELIDYALPAGATSGPKLLRIHFKTNPAYNTNYAIGYAGTNTVNDECGSNVWSSSPILRVTLPGGVTDFSVRFASTTHYELWNDITNTLLNCAGTGQGYFETGCSGNIQDLPGYYSFRFSIYLQFSGGLDAAYTSSYHTILEHPLAPPVLPETLPTPSGCSPGQFGQNTFFGHDYERARYVDGLLQVHYRIDQVNSNNSFKAFPITPDANCYFSLPNPTYFGPNVYFNEPVRYFSVRFSSPTHYDLWNDDTNTKIPATAGCTSCSVNFQTKPPYFLLYLFTGGGNDYVIGTPYPVVDPTLPPPPPVANYVSINSTTGTATLYLDITKTNKIKELPNGWALELLEDTGPVWKVRDVADNLTAYVDSASVLKASGQTTNVALKQQAARLTTDTRATRAKVVLDTVSNFWDAPVDGGSKASIGKLNTGLYNFVKTSGFPKELFLAMLTHESSAYNNEFVSFDYGHGITQATVIGYSKDVSYLQILLKKLGYYSTSTTGVFDKKYKTAVIAFQSANGVSPASGLVLQLTLAALNQKLSSERANIPDTDIPTGFTFRMFMMFDMSSKDRVDPKQMFDNRSSLLGIRVYPCFRYLDFDSQTAPEGYKNCYANYRMKANTEMSTPLATYYQNTPQSISSNLIAGLGVLAGVYNDKSSRVDTSPLPDIWKTENGVSIDNSDMKILLAVRGYNGLGSKFVSNISTEYPDLPLDPRDLDKKCVFYFRNEANKNSPWYLDAVASTSLTINSDYSTTSLSWATTTPLYKKLRLATKYRRELCIGSPAYLQITDSSGNVSGFNGTSIVNQIPNVLYDDQDHEAASILFPTGTYKYNVIGTETGTYKFAIVDDNSGVEKVVKVLDVPTTQGEVHEFSVDWANLTDTSGVIVRVDSSGDGVFDKVVLGGATLTKDQFTKGSGNKKANICHRPPDNPTNSKTMYLPASAILEHLAHGDKAGVCDN